MTDRVTGRTERRGYLQQLEREKNGLLAHIRDLEKLLQDKGIRVRPFQDPATSGYEAGPGAGAGAGTGTGTGRFDLDGTDGLGGGGGGSSAAKDPSQPFASLRVQDLHAERHRSASAGPSSLSSGGPRAGSPPPPPPPALSAAESRAFGAYLGVARDHAPLSSITGTQLSILGTTIDITLFDSPDMDGPPPGAPISTPLYNKSVQSFYNSVMRVNPPIDAPLPSRVDAFTYSEWFFVMVGGFMPVLHKPTYFKLVRKHRPPSPPSSFSA